MDYVKERLPLPEEFPFRIFRGCGSTDAVRLLHFHDCLELNLIKSGNGVNVIGDSEYELKPGEIYVLNNHEPHYAFSDGSLVMVVMVFEPLFIWMNNTFDYDFLKPFFERKVNFCNQIPPDNRFSKEIEALIDEIEKEYSEQAPGYKLVIKSLLMKVLALLYRHFKLEDQLGNELLQKQKETERISEAIYYIDAHFSEDIKLEMLAQLSHMNPTYFSGYFRKVMRMTPTDYITSLRINHAARLLKQSSKNVTEICSECGFSTLSHFNRIFRKHKAVSPSEYRKQDR